MARIVKPANENTRRLPGASSCFQPSWSRARRRKRRHRIPKGQAHARATKQAPNLQHCIGFG
jgi:hypothetical protein